MTELKMTKDEIFIGLNTQPPEEFDVLFDQFLLGYKEYRVLVQNEAINKDFD